MTYVADTRKWRVDFTAAQHKAMQKDPGTHVPELHTRLAEWPQCPCASASVYGSFVVIETDTKKKRDEAMDLIAEYIETIA